MYAMAETLQINLSWQTSLMVVDRVGRRELLGRASGMRSRSRRVIFLGSAVPGSVKVEQEVSQFVSDVPSRTLRALVDCVAGCGPAYHSASHHRSDPAAGRHHGTRHECSAEPPLTDLAVVTGRPLPDYGQSGRTEVQRSVPTQRPEVFEVVSCGECVGVVGSEDAGLVGE